MTPTATRLNRQYTRLMLSMFRQVPLPSPQMQLPMHIAVLSTDLRNVAALHPPHDVVITGCTPRHLSRAAEEAKLCGQFWNMFLPNRRALPLDLIRDKMGGWINVVQDLQSTDPVLRKTMLALSLTTLGKANDDEAMMREGTMFYGTALGELSAALPFARKAGVDTMLSAIRLFGVYEVCCPM